jgi:lysylphosphatidylglycerol synthetase-like protein (DUF2156 family)
MGDFWFKLKVWTKTTLFAIVVIYLLFFLYNNSGDTVPFWWWFGHKEDHGKLTFAFAAFMAGVILTVLVRTILATMHQVKDLQSRTRSQRIERDLQDMKEKAARLQTRSGASGTASGSTVPGAFEAPDPKID